MISIVNGLADRAKLISASVGLLGLAGCIAGWIFAPGDFFLGYLFAHFFFLGLSLGALGLLMIHHLTGGYWGYSVRRFLESAVGNLPFLSVLFVAVFLGFPFFFPCKIISVVATEEFLDGRFYFFNLRG